MILLFGVHTFLCCVSIFFIAINMYMYLRSTLKSLKYKYLRIINVMLLPSTVLD